MKITPIILFLAFFGLVSPSFSQHYGTAFGLRVGNSDLNRTLGITLQQRIINHITIEGIVQTDFSRNTMASVLAEKHMSLISKRFNLYYGGGLSFGNEESFVKNRNTKEIIHTYDNNTTGVDLIGGLELDLAGLALSFDYKPNFNITGREELYRGQMGFSLRTILVKSKTQKKNQKQRQKARKARSKSQSQKPSLNNPFKKK